MTDTEHLQQIIAQHIAKGIACPSNGYQIKIDWHKEDVPLCVPDEIVGEWHMARARRYSNGGWQVHYSYYRPQPTYCVMLHLKEGKVEVPGTRSHSEHDALIISGGLNATVLGTNQGIAPFQLHRLENTDE